MHAGRTGYALLFDLQREKGVYAFDDHHLIQTTDSVPFSNLLYGDELSTVMQYDSQMHRNAIDD